jgi:hypothetical protein
MTMAPLRLLVDGADPHAGGRADSPWFTLAPRLAADAAVQVTWLDRGSAPQAPGVRRLPFPSHGRGACAADSLLIQQLCDGLGIDVFASTGWTTPAGTASMCLVDSVSLSILATLTPPAKDERALALLFAQSVVCSTAAVHRGLMSEQPDIETRRLVLADLEWQIASPAEWAPVLTAQLVGLFHQLRAEARSGRWAWRFDEWRRLRHLQADVDV